MFGLPFKSYINPEVRKEADRQTWRLMSEGLLLGGTGLGILALIFEIAADAFSVAAYQTLLAIHGAGGYHEIAILAFIALSVMLFFGIVPAYKAGAYLRPNAGGSGPLVEAIGPARLRPLSWAGTSLFFLDAVLTIIISSISAADVTMLIFPEWAQYRILLAEGYAFFIMAVLVAVGPKRAVPLFLIGGGAFSIFTVIALSIVSANAAGNPQWAFLTDGILHRLEQTGVVEHVIRATQDIETIGTVVFFQLFMRSMSSAMLGFSGYEVIPASGKHAARPKWKVINTALTLAAIFLIGTGVLQLYAAQRWNIPSTEGYSTLLIEYEIVAAQTFGNGIDPDVDVDTLVTDDDVFAAVDSLPRNATEEQINEAAREFALARVIGESYRGTFGEAALTIAGALLAIILLLAQGGGYVGGAAVAANAARLGRMPRFFLDDRIGIAVIWGVSAVLIPIIREVVVVESYYAFGFVSAFIITSTTVFFVRADVLLERGIEPGSAEAKSLKFAGLRGMIASYIMGIVLVTQKTEALLLIAIFGALLTVFQYYMAHGGLRKQGVWPAAISTTAGTEPHYSSGIQRAYDEARQRGITDLMNTLLEEGKLVKFNVEPFRIHALVAYTHNVREEYIRGNGHLDHGEHFPEPSLDLEGIYQDTVARRDEFVSDIEYYSHYGIFTFIDKYYHNWVNDANGRGPDTVQQAMLNVLFPLSDPDTIWKEFQEYKWLKQPEAIWQFSRKRYQWAKDQWPNLSGRITTIWTLQDLGILPADLDYMSVTSIHTVNYEKAVHIHIHTDEPENHGHASHADSKEQTDGNDE